LRSLLRLRLLLAGSAERTVDVDGLAIRYFEATPSRPAPPDGASLVLVHGFGDSAETWAGVMPALGRRYRVVAPDLPGFGKTPIPPEGMHFSVVARYLARFLDTLRVDRVILAGNSLGGAVAIRYTASHPGRVAHLFLLDSAGLHGKVPPLIEPTTREMARSLAEIVTGSKRWLPRFILDDLVRQANDPARRAALRSPEEVDVTADLPRIDAPTTIIWGERDGLIPLDNGIRMRDSIPRAELIVLPGVAHVPQAEVPWRVVALIRERLQPTPAEQRDPASQAATDRDPARTSQR
jgi:pimeloyl-ACP methyl ester carboxylesterase